MRSNKRRERGRPLCHVISSPIDRDFFSFFFHHLFNFQHVERLYCLKSNKIGEMWRRWKLGGKNKYVIILTISWNPPTGLKFNNSNKQKEGDWRIILIKVWIWMQQSGAVTFNHSDHSGNFTSCGIPLGVIFVPGSQKWCTPSMSRWWRADCSDLEARTKVLISTATCMIKVRQSTCEWLSFFVISIGKW